MRYESFTKILNDKIFLEAKADLIRKLADYPERYVGLFRPTKPKWKIIQNLTQSWEIKFWDAFEVIIEDYFRESWYNVLENIIVQEWKKIYDLDQLFEKNGKIIFIEQKVRDDHDSSKKRGQIDNFIKKIEILQDKYPNNDIVANFYFIDDSLNKNKKYYENQIDLIQSDYWIKCSLFYWKELFNIYWMDYVWSEIIEFLTEWKKWIPDMPEINFDLDVDVSFNEIKKVELDKFRKIFRSDEIFNEMILTISPEKKLLKKLLEFFNEEYTKNNRKLIYKTLSDLLRERLGE